MVNNMIVSRFTGQLPEGVSSDRKILGEPLYAAHEILELLASCGSKAIYAWSRKCNEDIQKWALDADDLLGLVELAVRSGRYIGAEWCVQKPNGPRAACDAYSVIRREWRAAAHKEKDIEYYIKFAIGKTGNILLLVSCHPSENRR